MEFKITESQLNYLLSVLSKVEAGISYDAITLLKNLKKIEKEEG